MRNNYVFVGDNLSVMNSQVFRENAGLVDTIYIDPPYNTKRKFSYNDKQDRDKWLDFIKQRLVKAKELLKETGVIFISIDDNEYSYLKNLCDDIFQEKNCLGTFITMQSQRSNAKHINVVHEYVLAYAKDKKKAHEFRIKRMHIPSDRKMIESIVNSVKNDFIKNGNAHAQTVLNDLINKYCKDKNITWLKNYCSIDEVGNVYFGKDLSTPGNPRTVYIPEINLRLDALPSRGWSSDSKFKKLYEEGRLVYKNGRPYEKHYLTESEDNAQSVLDYYSRQGTHDLEKLGLKDLFDTPKPVELIKYLIRISTPKNGTVLDFFAGSGTTGQAVYEVNREDNSSRHYILIQLDEKIAKTTKAYEVCIKNGIEPLISETLIYRINTFLQNNNMLDDDLRIIRKVN